MFSSRFLLNWKFRPSLVKKSSLIIRFPQKIRFSGTLVDKLSAEIDSASRRKDLFSLRSFQNRLGLHLFERQSIPVLAASHLRAAHENAVAMAGSGHAHDAFIDLGGLLNDRAVVALSGGGDGSAPDSAPSEVDEAGARFWSQSNLKIAHELLGRARFSAERAYRPSPTLLSATYANLALAEAIACADAGRSHKETDDCDQLNDVAQKAGSHARKALAHAAAAQTTPLRGHGDAPVDDERLLRCGVLLGAARGLGAEAAFSADGVAGGFEEAMIAVAETLKEVRARPSPSSPKAGGPSPPPETGAAEIVDAGATAAPPLESRPFAHRPTENPSPEASCSEGTEWAGSSSSWRDVEARALATAAWLHMACARRHVWNQQRKQGEGVWREQLVEPEQRNPNSRDECHRDLFVSCAHLTNGGVLAEHSSGGVRKILEVNSLYSNARRNSGNDDVAGTLVGLLQRTARLVRPPGASQSPAPTLPELALWLDMAVALCEESPEKASDSLRKLARLPSSGANPVATHSTFGGEATSVATRRSALHNADTLAVSASTDVGEVALFSVARLEFGLPVFGATAVALLDRAGLGL